VRLPGDEPSHDVGRRLERLAGDVLREEAAMDEAARTSANRAFAW
jgi:hypothetical protein